MAATADAPCCEQALSQDQLAAALPAIDVQKIAETLNTLLNKVRARLGRLGGAETLRRALTSACGCRVEYKYSARVLQAHPLPMPRPSSSS